jgi:hypothetical protein
VRALLCPLFARSAWAQPAILMAGTKFEGAALASVRFVGVGSASHLMVCTTCDGAAPTSDRFVDVGSASHCGGGNDRLGRCYGLCSLGWFVLSLSLCWRTRESGLCSLGQRGLSLHCVGGHYT